MEKPHVLSLTPKFLYDRCKVQQRLNLTPKHLYDRRKIQHGFSLWKNLMCFLLHQSFCTIGAKFSLCLTSRQSTTKFSFLPSVPESHRIGALSEKARSQTFTAGGDFHSAPKQRMKFLPERAFALISLKAEPITRSQSLLPEDRRSVNQIQAARRTSDS